MAIEANRMLGGVGSALIVISAVSPILVLPRLSDMYSTSANVISPVSSVLGLASLSGIILFMVAMRGFAGHYKDHRIFDNALYGFLSTIVVSALAGVAMVALIFMNFGDVISAFTSIPVQAEFFQSILSYMVPVMPIFSSASLIQALFMMRAFNILAFKSEARLFKTAGWALVAGSVLSLILACIGTLLFFAASISAITALAIYFAGMMTSYLAWIFATKAFFSIKTPTSHPLPVSPVDRKTRYCPHCGAENITNAGFCTHCGKKL